MTPEEEVPAGWPPTEAVGSTVVPLFPLPNLFLFPGTVVPLHIFEPRYRQMIEDSLDGPGRLVVGTILENHHEDLGGSPPVHHVAGLGEIARHERLPDGRFVIMLVGLTRVRVQEADSDRLYRQVRVEALSEVPVPDDEIGVLREQLLAAVMERTPRLKDREEELPDDMPIGHLTDLLLLRMQLPQSAMQPLYSEVVVAERARQTLEEHAHRPIPDPEDGEPDADS